MYRLNSHLPDFLAATAGVSSIAAWQEQLDWSLKIFATLVAIAAGVASLMSHYKRRKQRKNPLAGQD